VSATAALASKPWKTYAVTVANFGPTTLAAPSRSKARYDAFTSYRECYTVSFRDFLAMCSVRACPVPAHDGYDYVRRNYDVDPTVGQRVWLINEGSSSGQSGFVVYPGQSTASVHVVIDGRNFPVRVHPTNISFSPPSPALEASTLQSTGG
jgi:hypothetical protein